MLSLWRAQHRDDIEPDRQMIPAAILQQEIRRGPAQPCLLYSADRGQRPPVTVAHALPHLDDDQHTGIPADQIEFTASTSKVARDQLEAALEEVPLGQLLR